MCHHRRTCFLIVGLPGLILEPVGADIPPCVGGLELVAVLEEPPLDGALRTFLAAKLSLALAALRAPHARQLNDAGYKIGAFISQVEAQAGSAISDADGRKIGHHRSDA